MSSYNDEGRLDAKDRIRKQEGVPFKVKRGRKPLVTGRLGEYQRHRAS